MIVLIATQSQYNNLNETTLGVSVLQFTKDGLGRWIVGQEVLVDENFLEIRSDLELLKKIEYVAPNVD
jgi:hypothetical protein